MNKVKEIIKKVLHCRFLSPFLGFFSFLLLDTAFRFFYQFSGCTPPFSSQPLWFGVGWSLFFIAITALLPRLFRRIAMAVLMLLFSVLTLVHGAMYKIFGNFFSFADMGFAGDGAKFFSWSYLGFRKGFLLCLGLSLCLMGLAIYLVPPKLENKRKRLAGKGGAAILAAVAFIPICWAHTSLTPKADTVWWGNAYDPNADSSVYSEFSNTNRCFMLTGLYQYTFRNFAVSFGLEGRSPEKGRLDAYYESREVSGSHELTGALKDKNLLMVMLESVDTWLLTEDYMPNLYRLQQQSIDFINHYTPLYLSAGTFNTEIASLTGLIPAVTGLPSSAYSTNNFPLALPNLFREAGYSANSFHSSYPGIYSRGTVHTNLGFEAYHSFEDMGMEDYMLDSQLMAGYKQMTEGEKFYSYLITYSGHGPYTEELQNISGPHYEAAKAAVAKSGVSGSEANMEEYTLAVAHAMETDAFIGQLWEQLQADGRHKDTVLVFYTDHYGKYMSDSDFLRQIKGVKEGSPELYRTPFFLYAEGLEPQKVEKYTSTVDIAPTLVSLFGLEADRRYYAGDDIFGDLGGVVFFPNYSWYNGGTYYSENYQGGITSETERISLLVRERINASWDSLRSNYFSHWA